MDSPKSINTTVNSKYDALVIGGGIQGAGCAQALAARGHRVVLLEQSQFGAATSSKSSKLIHGGLRYLETAQFSLVRKSLTERATLLKIAPTLVKSKNFYLPVYRGQRLNRWKLFAGLALYSALGGFAHQARFRRIPKAQWHLLTGLSTTGLIDVFLYHDAQTDDQVLTQAVMHSAAELGCDAFENAQFLSAEKHIDGTFKVQTLIDGDNQHFQCRLIVNAAGPWVDQVQQKISSAPSGPEMELIQGTHIEFDAPLTDDIFYVESPDDKRAVFIMPWQGRVMVGTTEKQHVGDPANATPSDAEVEYLKRTLHHYFPHYTGRFLKAWCGLRVLPMVSRSSKNLRPFSARARDTVVLTDSPNTPTTISLYGGKLTAYRITADKVAKIAEKTLGTHESIKDTAAITLT